MLYFWTLLNTRWRCRVWNTSCLDFTIMSSIYTSNVSPISYLKILFIILWSVASTFFNSGSWHARSWMLSLSGQVWTLVSDCIQSKRPRRILIGSRMSYPQSFRWQATFGSIWGISCRDITKRSMFTWRHSINMDLTSRESSNLIFTDRVMLSSNWTDSNFTLKVGITSSSHAYRLEVAASTYSSSPSGANAIMSPRIWTMIHLDSPRSELVATDLYSLSW